MRNAKRANYSLILIIENKRTPVQIVYFKQLYVSKMRERKY